MKVKELVKDLPLADIVATAEIGDRNLTPPEHITNVVKLAWADPNITVSEDVANYFRNWVTEQQALQALAARVLEELERVAPLPTPSDLMNGNPEWPAWVGKWWGQVLRFPWAGRLSDAIAEAWIWADGAEGWVWEG